MKLRVTILSGLLGLISYTTSAQCDDVASWCTDNLSEEFISDGQTYRALLYNDQIAEFKLTLFGGTTYRVAACSGEENSNLLFRIFDEEKNELFSNTDFANAPYWDFVVDSTIDCKLEAQLDLNKKESGCAVILIGFKE
jgi:hypothetical protein